MEQIRQEIQRILEAVGIEAATEMANTQESIFGTINNLEAFVCEELHHLDQRRRRKNLNPAAYIIQEECRRFLERPRPPVDTKSEPQNDYLDVQLEEVNVETRVKEEPAE